MNDNHDMCTCGETQPHIVARRKSADDYVVLYWSDGDVSSAMGLTLRGVGRARYACMRRRDRQATLAFMDDTALFDFAELGTAIRAVRKLFRGWNWSGDAPPPDTIRLTATRACTRTPSKEHP